MSLPPRSIKALLDTVYLFHNTLECQGETFNNGHEIFI